MTVTNDKLFKKNLALISEGELSQYSSRRSHFGEFTYWQLASILYPNELEQVRRRATLTTMISSLILMICSMYLFIIATNGDSHWYKSGMVALMFSWLPIFMMMTEFQKILKKRYLSHGLVNTCTIELQAFSDALETVLDQLELLVDDFSVMGREEATERAKKLLAAKAVDVVRAEKILDADPCDTSEDFYTWQHQVGENRKGFKRSYDAFALLGLAGDGHTNYFRAAYKVLEEEHVAA